MAWEYVFIITHVHFILYCCFQLALINKHRSAVTLKVIILTRVERLDSSQRLCEVSFPLHTPLSVLQPLPDTESVRWLITDVANQICKYQKRGWFKELCLLSTNHERKANMFMDFVWANRIWYGAYPIWLSSQWTDGNNAVYWPVWEVQ